MPKEVIHDPRQSFKTIIGWSPGTVQVGVALDPKSSDQAKTLVHLAGMLMEQDKDGGGLYMDFNRQQINHLIKTLRQARDRAFGKDE